MMRKGFRSATCRTSRRKRRAGSARSSTRQGARWVRQEGVAIVVTLDLSLSMAASDVIPDRLTVAKQEVGELLDRVRGDRVGLVIFSGDAFIRFPLTRDVVVAGDIVAALDPGEPLVRSGSDVAAAIDAARRVLAPSAAAAKVILLVSDGESLHGDELAAARRAAADGLRIFTALAGTEAGATIPVRDSDSGRIVPKIDSRTGDPVITRADPQTLDAIARIGGGRLIRLDRAGALSEVVRDLAALDATAFALKSEGLPIERFQAFAAIALALLLIEPLIPTGPRRPGRRRLRRPRAIRRLALAALAGLIALTAAACASTALERNEAGNRYSSIGRTTAALAAYRDAQLEAPDDPRINLNIGRVLHANESYEPAVSESARAVGADDGLSARAFYQIGGHRLAEGDIVAARDAYIEALLLDPSDQDAKFNLELVNLVHFRGRTAPPRDTEARPVDPDGEPVAAPGPSEAELAEQLREDLQTAFDSIVRENPTTEEALDLLDALRARQPIDLYYGGAGLPYVPVAGEDDY